MALFGVSGIGIVRVSGFLALNRVVSIIPVILINIIWL
jgi:hypothetical protein